MERDQITLALLTESNMDQLRDIQRDDISEVFVDIKEPPAQAASPSVEASKK